MNGRSNKQLIQSDGSSARRHAKVLHRKLVVFLRQMMRLRGVRAAAAVTVTVTVTCDMSRVSTLEMGA